MKEAIYGFKVLQINFKEERIYGVGLSKTWGRLHSTPYGLPFSEYEHPFLWDRLHNEQIGFILVSMLERKVKESIEFLVEGSPFWDKHRELVEFDTDWLDQCVDELENALSLQSNDLWEDFAIRTANLISLNPLYTLVEE